MTRTVFLVAMGAWLLACPAAAQDEPHVGIVMGYPASIGLLWQISGRFAVRPELSLSRGSSESTGGIALAGISSQSASDSWQAGFGASAIFYTSTGDGLRTYVTPRVAYTRSSLTGTTTTTGIPTLPFVPPTPRTTEITSTTYSYSGAFGAQYALGRRFSLFGELGLAYQRGTLGDNSTIGDTKSTVVGLRSGVGVVLYLGS